MAKAKNNRLRAPRKGRGTTGKNGKGRSVDIMPRGQSMHQAEVNGLNGIVGHDVAPTGGINLSDKREKRAADLLGKKDRTPIQSAVDMTLRQANPRGYLAGAAPMAREIILPMDSEAEIGEIARTVDALPGLSVEYDPEIGRAYIGRTGKGVPLSQLHSSVKARRPSPNALRGLPASVSEMYEQRAKSALWCTTERGMRSFEQVAANFQVHGANLPAITLRDWYYWSLTTHNAWWCSREITKNISDAAAALQDWTLHTTLFPEPAGYVWFEGGMPGAEMMNEGIVMDDNGPKAYTSQHDLIQGFTWAKVYEADENPSMGHNERRMHTTHALRSEVERVQPNAVITERVTFFLFTAPVRGGFVGTMSYHWPLGMTLHEMLEAMGPERDDMDSVRLRVLGTFLLWCKQRILVEGSRATPDRASRRRVDALQSNRGDEKRIDIQEIKVVTLRATDRRPKDAPDDQDEKREYSCRWIVRPFWRQQWYPSLGIHQPKYIESYIKGPQEMPLRIPKQTLFAVTR